MDAKKAAYKKLTNANGMIRAFSIIALILSMIGVLLEPVGKLIYNMIFTRKIDYLFVEGIKNYIEFSEIFFVFLAMSIALMIAAFSSKTKKNIGQGFSSLLVLVPAILAVDPFMDMLDYFDSGAFRLYMKSADNLKYRGIIYLSYYIIVIAVAVMFVICGIALLVKASGEKATEITAVPRKSKKNPQQGFNPQGQFIPQNGTNPQNQFNMNNQFSQPGFNDPGNAATAAAFAMPSSDNAFKPDSNTIAPAPQTAENKFVQNDPSTFAPANNNAVMASAPIPETVKNEASAVIPQHNANDESDGLQKVCPDCGTVLAPTAKFCKHCGKAV